MGNDRTRGGRGGVRLTPASSKFRQLADANSANYKDHVEFSRHFEISSGACD